MVTRSESEALRLLQATRARVIVQGYEIAVELARRDGTVHSQAVLREMDRRGLLPLEKKFRRNWTAVIFKGAAYKHIWKRVGLVKVGDGSRNTHATLRSVWRLRDEPADYSRVCWGEDPDEGEL